MILSLSCVLWKNSMSILCKNKLNLPSFSKHSISTCTPNYNKHDGVHCSELIMEEYGDPDKVLKIRQSKIPALQPGDVLVRMLATTINPSDINSIQGTYAVKPTLPCVLGNEGVAQVLETTNSKGDLRPGDWVIPAKEAWGTWRTHAVAPEQDFIKLSPGLTLPAAATISINPCTAYRVLRDFVALAPGDTVLQNAANSSVGRAVIQLCAEWGYRSINIVRDRPTIGQLKDELLSLGAHMVLTETELRSNRSLLTGSSRPSLALNCVSGKSATELLRHMTDGGTMVTYGGMARQPVVVPVGSLIFNDVRLRGYWQTRWCRDPENRVARLAMLSDVSSLLLRGALQPPPHTMVPFAEFARAVTDAMPVSGQVGAKQILVFGDDEGET